MFSTRKAYVAYVALSVLVLAAGYFFSVPKSVVQVGPRIVHLSGQTIRVSVADTEASRELGLGGREGLASDEGMLFVFPEDGVHAFWMKGMKFSIDILWIDSQGKIIYIAQNIAPETYPKSFGPGTPVRYVLELPANYALQHGIKAGDEVQL